MLFTRDGIESTAMEQIAGAVQVTRRTLYSYFPSKDDIGLTIMTSELAERWAAQKKALAHLKPATGLEALIIWSRVLYDYSKASLHSLMLQLYFDLKGIDRQRISKETFAAFEELNEELADGLREIFRRGVSDGSMRQDLQIDMAISQFLYALRSILNRALSPSYSFAEFDPDEYVEQYLKMLTRGLANNKRSKE